MAWVGARLLCTPLSVARESGVTLPRPLLTASMIWAWVGARLLGTPLSVARESGVTSPRPSLLRVWTSLTSAAPASSSRRVPSLCLRPRASRSLCLEPRPPSWEQSSCLKSFTTPGQFEHGQRFCLKVTRAKVRASHAGESTGRCSQSQSRTVAERQPKFFGTHPDP